MKTPIDEKRLLLAEYEMNAYKYFIPNGAVEQYIRAVGDMLDKRIFLFSAANAVGKTSGVINILANIIFENKNKYFKYPRFESWDLPKRFWYISEHTTLKETVATELEKWLPFGRYTLTKSQGYPVSLTSDTGWTGEFKRYDQEAAKFESATLGIIIFDEPSPEAIYNACISRLRLGGIILMPMTPLFKAAFVKDKIVDGNPHAYVQYADMEENCKEHGRRGILEHETIEFMADQMEEEEKEARLHGKFMFLAGLVFKEFNRAVHVISVDQIERIWIPSVYGKFEDWPKVMVIDPHDRRADAIVWAALTPDGSWIVFDEYPDQDFYLIKSRTDNINQTLEKCRSKEAGRTQKEWKALAGTEPLKIMRRIMDRRKGAQNVSDAGLTLKDLYVTRSKEMGWPQSIETSYDDHNKLDHKQIHDALRYEQTEQGLTVRPKLYVLRDCRNTIYCFEHYSWDDWSGKTADKRGLKEQVKDKYKDYIDDVRYLLGENIKYERVISREVDGRDRFRNTEQRGWMAA